MPEVAINFAHTARDQVTAGRERVLSIDTWLSALTVHDRRPSKEYRDDGRPTCYTAARFSTEACTCGDPQCPDAGWQLGEPVHGHRLAINVLAVTGLVIDADKDATGAPLTPETATALLSAFAAKRIRAAIYTTHSHTPAEPHYRVFVALDREVPIAEWKRFLPAALAFVGIPPGCHADARHIWYLPSAPEGAPAEAVVLDGDPLNVGMILLTAPAVVPQTPRTRRGAPAGATVLDADRQEALELLAAAWPHQGTRYSRRLELAGALAHSGWEEPEIITFLDALVAATNDGIHPHGACEANIRLASASVSKVADGEPVTGWTTLATSLGVNVIDRVRAALDRQRQREHAEIAAHARLMGKLEEDKRLGAIVVPAMTCLLRRPAGLGLVGSRRPDHTAQQRRRHNASRQ